MSCSYRKLIVRSKETTAKILCIIINIKFDANGQRALSLPLLPLPLLSLFFSFSLFLPQSVSRIVFYFSRIDRQETQIYDALRDDVAIANTRGGGKFAVVSETRENQQ